MNFKTGVIVILVAVALYAAIALLAKVNRTADRDPQPNTHGVVSTWG